MAYRIPYIFVKVILIGAVGLCILMSFLPQGMHKFNTELRNSRTKAVDAKFLETKSLPCEPHKHIFFLKVMKTGSSTFASILNGMILKYNLTTYVILKKIPHPTQLLLLLDGKHLTVNTSLRFDTQATHGNFQEGLVRSLMKKGTQYIATIRHPFYQYRSQYFYRHRDQSFAEISENMEKHLQQSFFSRKQNKWVLPVKSTPPNYQFNYFGFDYQEALSNHTYVKECLNHVADLFNIIITEYYDESVLLLKEKFCWSFKDILFMVHKNASFSGKERDPSDYGILYEKHKNISHLDYALYNHLLNIHKQQVLKAGIDFQEKLMLYQDIKARANSFCSNIYTNLIEESNTAAFHQIWSKNYTTEANQFYESVTITGKDCVKSFVCDGKIKSAIIALNYPILCSRNFRNIKFDHIFCQSNETNNQDVFHYENLYFQLKYLKELISCDMDMNYT